MMTKNSNGVMAFLPFYLWEISLAAKAAGIAAWLGQNAVTGRACMSPLPPQAPPVRHINMALPEGQLSARCCGWGQGV